MKCFYRSRWFDGFVVGLAMFGGLFATARMALQPRDPAAGVAVVFAPWVSGEAALMRAAQAGARIVRFGGLSSVVIVIPDIPDYAARVMAQGALLVADPELLRGCFGG